MEREDIKMLVKKWWEVCDDEEEVLQKGAEPMPSAAVGAALL